MKKLCFATNNPNKLSEIRQLLDTNFDIQSLQDIGCNEELPETQDTLEGNSRQKAQYVFEHYCIECFADDTGLEVAALDGAPGVYSARYAGPSRDAAANMALLMKNMAGVEHTYAQFKTVITLISGNGVEQFTGVVGGDILTEPKGDDGFGYDPIFQPVGYTKSFAQMTSEEKNAISHRGLAVAKLVEHLRAR